jgi:putative hydrolase of the HAD superfamily
MNWHLAPSHPFADVRLLTFDLDDTLWPCFPTIQAAEQEVHDWFRRSAPLLAEKYDIDSLREHRMQVAQENPHMAHDLSAIRMSSYRELARRHGLPEDLAREANAIFRRARNRVMPYAEVTEVLTRLRDFYVLVAVSNGNAQIEKTPLAGCFHYAFMAEEVGAAKPAPALFRAASGAAGIPLNQAAHVGDDPKRDVEAARHAGLRGIWVNRREAEWPPELAPPDLQVPNLYRLQEVLMQGREI